LLINPTAQFVKSDLVANKSTASQVFSDSFADQNLNFADFMRGRGLYLRRASCAIANASLG
jgi:hypothetical protein